MLKLLIGGSPCTHWSIAQTRNRETRPEGMGWELFKNYLIARDKYSPDYFLYENNKSMSSAIREQITRELGVEPILINSALVSAQNRQRLYWTNIPGVCQPEDRGILLRDVLESGVCWREKGYSLLASSSTGKTAEDMIARRQSNGVAEPIKPLSEREMDYMVRETSGGRNHFDFEYFQDGNRDKSACLTANLSRGVPYNVICDPVRVGINHLGSLYGQHSRWGIFGTDGKAPMLTASAGMGGGHIPMISEPVRIGTIESAARNADFDSQQYRVYSPDGKSVTLCGNGGGVGTKTGLYAAPVEPPQGMAWRGHAAHGNPSSFEMRKDGKSNAVIVGHQNRLVITSPNGKTLPVYEVRDGLITIKGKQYPIKLRDGCYIIRKLTVTECMRLQTVPDSYEFPVSDSQAYKMLGNGWTVEVIMHLMRHFDGITTEPLDVLSMYDGMACGHIALDNLGANIRNYYATEIDKYAIATATHNFPDIVELGDAFQIRWDMEGAV